MVCAKGKCKPIVLCHSGPNLDIVKLLSVKKYCDPNIYNDSPLHLAGHLQVVSFFSEELKRCPDIMGQHNKTPYEMAIMLSIFVNTV